MPETIVEPVPGRRSWIRGRAGLWGIAIAALALMAIIYGRTVATLWRMWSHNDTYSHGFLIAPVSLFLVWTLRRALRDTPASPTWAGLPVVALAVLMQFAGIRGDVTMFQAYSLILLTAGLAWTWFGTGVLRRLAFPIAFLAFAAPTFPVIVNQVSFRLKAIAAFGSVSLAQLSGVSVSLQGMDLYMPTGVMTIEGACSGLNSLIALMALGALFAYLGTGAAWKRWLLFVLSVPVAVAGQHRPDNVALRVRGADGHDPGYRALSQHRRIRAVRVRAPGHVPVEEAAAMLKNARVLTSFGLLALLAAYVIGLPAAGTRGYGPGHLPDGAGGDARHQTRARAGGFGRPRPGRLPDPAVHPAGRCSGLARDRLFPERAVGGPRPPDLLSLPGIPRAGAARGEPSHRGRPVPVPQFRGGEGPPPRAGALSLVHRGWPPRGRKGMEG